MTSSGGSGGAGVPCIPLNVRFRRESGRYLAVGYEYTLELSDIAAFIWKQIDGCRSVAAIAQIVSDQYMVDEATALTDARELFDDLAAHDLISWTQ
jgi:pyrroloquinoline quinone biosynthesis protein D